MYLNTNINETNLIKQMKKNFILYDFWCNKLLKR